VSIYKLVTNPISRIVTISRTVNKYTRLDMKIETHRWGRRNAQLGIWFEKCTIFKSDRHRHTHRRTHFIPDIDKKFKTPTEEINALTTALTSRCSYIEVDIH